MSFFIHFTTQFLKEEFTPVSGSRDWLVQAQNCLYIDDADHYGLERFYFSFRSLRADPLLLCLRFCTIPPVTRWLWMFLDEDISVSLFSLSCAFLVLPANG